ncbi:MAG: hypothetical protein IKG21_01095 [Atopobiaceae bacterium]|nr:hypothetical protein [Atopobiaceae bacterium]
MNWGEILDELPSDTRAEFEKQLRRSLTRRLRAIRTYADPSLVPDSIRSLAVGEWRKQFMKDASKGAKRRMKYERLRHDPTYQQLERAIVEKHCSNSPGAQTVANEVARMTFEQACEEFRRSKPSYGSTGLEGFVGNRIRAAYKDVVKPDAMRAEIEHRVREVARTKDLFEFAHVTMPGGTAFGLQELTDEQQIAARVQGTRLVDHIVRKLYDASSQSVRARKRHHTRGGRRAYDASMDLTKSSHDVVRTLIVCELVQHPVVRALNTLVSQLCDTPQPLENTLRRIASNDARAIVGALQSEDFARVVAEDLLRNSLYARQFEQSVELLLRVRSNVPQTPMDAFPLARTMHRHFVVHVGPTNSGKTHDAIAALSVAESGAYLGPLRLLAYEQFEQLNLLGCACSLLTGEELIEVPAARHVSSTIEMARYDIPLEVAVIDEAQMLADPSRGHNWTNALLGIPAREVHVCCAPHAETVVRKLIELCGDTCDIICHERLVPLVRNKGRFRLPQDVQAGDALVVFSRKSVHTVASIVSAHGLRPSLVYGALPYEVRHEEARKFDEGTTDVIVATDAIGMGMNLPIRRIVFVEQDKYDGREHRMLRAEEIQQIAGRAGRYGRYNKGLFTSTRRCGEIAGLFRQSIDEITTIPVGIPENIALVRDATLSDSIRMWMGIEQPEPFVRIDVWRDLKLVSEIEAKLSPDEAVSIETKETVFALATMPFDERDRRLLAVWRRMVDAQLAHETVEFALPEVDAPGTERAGAAPSGTDRAGTALPEIDAPGTERAGTVPSGTDSTLSPTRATETSPSLTAKRDSRPTHNPSTLAKLEADYKYCDLLYNYERAFGSRERMQELVNRRNRIARIIMDMLDANS